MNGQQFRTFFWLRWRIRVNQLKRGGLGNKVVLVLLGGAAVLLAMLLFAAAFLIGDRPLANAPATVIMYAYLAAVLVFLFLWTSGLVADLQRSEVLALDKFLHLPVSLLGAFVVNYLSSLFSLTLLLFVPAMLGLTLGLVASRGVAMLVLLPALAALILMVTAVTHQFQGWLASLMLNQRRRRTIIAVLTMLFVLFSQVPNLINQWSFADDSGPRTQKLIDAQNELYRVCADGQITLPVYEARLEKLHSDFQAETEAIHRRKWEQIERITTAAGLFIPPAWLPLAARAATEGKLPPAALATLGMALIGSVSLWRSYRTTLRLYSGQVTAGGPRATARPATVPQPALAAVPVATLLEKQIPWLPESAAVVALGTMRSLLRAPEIKMAMLSPLLMLVVMAPVMMRGSQMPESARPMLAFGTMTFVLLVVAGLMGNQFGFDRSGFQVFILSGVRRRDILLGKNLATAPLALGMGLFVVAAMQFVSPMRWTYLVAVPVEFLSMYLMFCLVANLMSIYTPINVPAGSLRRARPTGMALVVQLLAMFLFLPLTMSPMLIPLGAQMLYEHSGGNSRMPICLLLSLVECLAVALLYWFLLDWQGNLLQAREQKIYAVVRSKED